MQKFFESRRYPYLREEFRPVVAQIVAACALSDSAKSLRNERMASFVASARVAGFVKQRVHIAGDRHAVEIVFILHECRCYVWDDPSAISRPASIRREVAMPVVRHVENREPRGIVRLSGARTSSFVVSERRGRPVRRIGWGASG